eukprot:comp19612_c0_seq1/m.23115 comp19612_c0_seq1/g.23115  ORF comp19612_c0_seq1/g.23115 comp19612_c0_seq1/m.23115 type:complete len:512 (-) comp19612_c0_seq1:233-1768(-)
MDSLDFLDKAPLGRRRSRSVGNLTQLNTLTTPQVFNPAPVYVQTPQPVGISGIYAGPMVKMINSLLTEAEKQRIRAFDQMQQSIESLQRPPQRMYMRQQPPPQMPMGLQVQPQFGAPLPPQTPMSNPGSHGGLPSYVPLTQNFQPSPMSQPLNPSSMKFGPAVTHGAPYSPVSPTMRSPRSQAPGSPYAGLGTGGGGRPQSLGLDAAQGLDFSHPIKSIARKRSSSLSCLPRLRGDMPVPMLNVDLDLQIPPIEVSGPSQQWQPAGAPPPAPTVADYQDKESKLREFESFLEFPDPHISEAERKMGRTTDRNRAKSMPTVARQPLYPAQSLPSGGTPLTPILGYPESGGLLDPSGMGGLDVNMPDMAPIPAIQVQQAVSPHLGGSMSAGTDSGSWLGGTAITTNESGEFDLDIPMQNAFRQMSITENPAGNLQQNPNAMNVFGGPAGGTYAQGSANRSVSGIVREILGESGGLNSGSGGLNGSGNWQVGVEEANKNELMRLDTETINRLIN